jgi:hypothetical protein
MGVSRYAGVNWYNDQINYETKMIPQMLKAQPAGVTIVWYFADSSPLVGVPKTPPVPIKKEI